MNFSDVIPVQIYTWIQERCDGNGENYDKCKEDTLEAIDVFSSLYGSTFRTPYQLFIYLYENLCMRNAKNQSFYRAFIAIQNDDVITIRLSQHFATKGSVKTANKNFGKPTVEYHLIIERTQIVNPDNDLFFDRRFKSVTFKIREMDLAEFNDGHFRKDTIDEIIRLLTYGDGSSGNNNLRINTENKHMSTNKKVIRLTESELRNIIAESVEMILMEGKYVNNKPGFGERIVNDFFLPTDNVLQHIENNPKLKTKQEKGDAYAKATKKHAERQNNKTFVDPLLQKHNERRRELVGRSARGNRLNPFGEINKWNAIPSSYESDYIEDDAVDIIVNYDLLPKSIKPKNFIAGKDMSPEGEIVYGHLSPASIYRRLRKAGVPENAITIYNC